LIWKYILNLFHLLLYSLTHNSISGSGVHLLTDALKVNQRLQKLEWVQHLIFAMALKCGRCILFRNITLLQLILVVATTQMDTTQAIPNWFHVSWIYQHLSRVQVCCVEYLPKCTCGTMIMQQGCNDLCV